MIRLLAVLSASAAAGMRIALPLLSFGLLQGERLWVDVPILSSIPAPVVVGLLTSLSVVELFASKNFLGQRVLQLFELWFSPVVGVLIGLGVARSHHGATTLLIWLFAVVGGLFALLLQLNQARRFYALQGLPLWFVFVQDVLSVILVILALYAPITGGVIALVILFLAVRSASL